MDVNSGESSGIQNNMNNGGNQGNTIYGNTNNNGMATGNMGNRNGDNNGNNLYNMNDGNQNYMNNRQFVNMSPHEKFNELLIESSKVLKSKVNETNEIYKNQENISGSIFNYLASLVSGRKFSDKFDNDWILKNDSHPPNGFNPCTTPQRSIWYIIKLFNNKGPYKQDILFDLINSIIEKKTYFWGSVDSEEAAILFSNFFTEIVKQNYDIFILTYFWMNSFDGPFQTCTRTFEHLDSQIIGGIAKNKQFISGYQFSSLLPCAFSQRLIFSKFISYFNLSLSFDDPTSIIPLDIDASVIFNLLSNFKFTKKLGDTIKDWIFKKETFISKDTELIFFKALVSMFVTNIFSKDYHFTINQHLEYLVKNDNVAFSMLLDHELFSKSIKYSNTHLDFNKPETILDFIKLNSKGLSKIGNFLNKISSAVKFNSLFIDILNIEGDYGLIGDVKQCILEKINGDQMLFLNFSISNPKFNGLEYKFQSYSYYDEMLKTVTNFESNYGKHQYQDLSKLSIKSSENYPKYYSFVQSLIEKIHIDRLVSSYSFKSNNSHVMVIGHILVATSIFDFIIQNGFASIGNYIYHQVYGFGSYVMNARKEDDSWLEDVATLLEKRELIKGLLIEKAKSIAENNCSFDKDTYTKIQRSLKTNFDNYDIPSGDILYQENQRLEKEIKEISLIEEFLSFQFLNNNKKFKPNPNQVNSNLEGKKTSLLEYILGLDLQGYLKLNGQFIEFLKYFLVNKSSFFTIIFQHFKENCSSASNVNEICRDTEKFILDLSHMDTNIKLDIQMFTKLANSQNSFNDEISLICGYKSSYGKAVIDVKKFKEYIEGTIALFSLQSNIESCLIPFLNANSTFIKIEDLKEATESINQSFGRLKGSEISYKESAEFKRTIDIKIGNLKYHQISFFGVIQTDLIKFFADNFVDKKDFGDRTTMISTNTTNAVSSKLMDYSLYIFKFLEPIILDYQKKTNSYKKLEQFCQNFDKVLPQDSIDTEDIIDKIKSLQSNFPHLVSIYSSSGGFLDIQEILKSSTFISSEINGNLVWSIKVGNDLNHTQEKLEEIVRGLILSEIKDTQKETVENFKFLINLLKSIHKSHTMLVTMFHCGYLKKKIEIEISPDLIDSIIEQNETMSTNIRLWDNFINSFSKRIRLLRNQRISSLSTIIIKFLSENKTVVANDTINLSKSLYPYIKYCYPISSNVTCNEIKKLINLNEVQNGILKRDMETGKYISNLFSIFDKSFIHDDIEGESSDSGPIYFQISKDNIKNLDLYLMQMNDSVIVHPNQIFYGSNFEIESQDFYYLVENVKDRNFFLIGLPENRSELLSWFAKFYSDQTLSNLSRVYIISFETSDTFNGVLSKYSEKLESEDWVNYKAEFKKINNFCGIQSIDLLSGEKCGKTKFIKKKIISSNHHYTLLVRPNTNYLHFFEYLKQVLLNSNGLELGVILHINVSPYANYFQLYSSIYQLLTYGFITNCQTGEIFNTTGFIKFQVFIEIGLPLKNNGLPEDHLSIIYNCCNRVDYGIIGWDFETEDFRCLSFQDFKNNVKSTIISNYKLINPNLDNYFKHLSSIAGEGAITYLKDPKYKQSLKNFFMLLNERLQYLDCYIDTHFFKLKEYGAAGPLDPIQLYHLLITESIQLADPNLCSCEDIWDNPPLLSSRSIIPNDCKELKIDKLTWLEYIDFTKSQDKLPLGITRHTIKSAIENTKVFNHQLSSNFGITGRTYLLSDLAKQYNYVLTPEFALRLLILHERIKNQRSIILNGDTGTGKTYILIFYSTIINAKWDVLPDILQQLRKVFKDSIERYKKNRVFDLVTKKVIDPVTKAEIDNSKILKYKNIINSSIGEYTLVAEKVIKMGTHSNDLYTDFTKFARLIIGNPLVNIEKESSLFQIKDKVVDSKDLLVKAMNEISSIKFKGLFHRIVMHAKYTSIEFIEKVKSLDNEALVISNVDCNLTVLIFIDEFNTASEDTLALINELFNDGTLDGQQLKAKNCRFIGAMNPEMKDRSNKVNLNYTGHVSESSKSEFIVKDPHPSLKKYYFDFGLFNEKSELSFINTMFENFSHGIERSDFIVHIKDCIIIGQRFLRAVNQTRTHVSIRDIYRVIELYKFFTKDVCGKSIIECDSYSGYSALETHWHALVTSLFLTYVLRLESTNLDNRKKLIKEFDDYSISRDIRSELSVKPFNLIFKNKYTKLCTDFIPKYKEGEVGVLPQGVALTESLMLNIFCMLVCINTSIPLLVVGPPGCSKTLSFSIVIDLIKNTKILVNEKTIKSPFYHTPFSDPFRYQCTEYTTDLEIQAKFLQAIHRGISTKTFRGIVFLDEAGLVDEETSPMKVLHDYLDQLSKKIGKSSDNLGIIILSNKILDAAKTNRMLVLCHPEFISEEDEKALVHGCLFDNEEIDEDKKQVLNGLCNAYKKVNNFSKSTKDSLFCQRDFVFFLRHLKRCQKVENKPFDISLLESLERNFRGIPQFEFQQLASLFFNQLKLVAPESLKTDNTIANIKSSLNEIMNTNQNPSTFTFRYIMVFDPSENESGLQVLNEIFKTTNKLSKVVVVRIGGFEKDQTDESLVYNISEIKKEMETGGTVVLVNGDKISSSFYEVFNRYFYVMPSSDKKGKEFYADVSFGSNSVNSKIHPDFKIIVHVPISKLKNTQLPFLNRFEKYILSIDHLTKQIVDKSESKLIQYSNLNKYINHFVDSLQVKCSNNSLLAGYSNETASSLIYSLMKYYDENNGANSNENGKQLNEFYKSIGGNNNIDKQSSSIMEDQTKLNFKLLQITKPESLIRFKDSFPKNYIREYLLNQEHFSIIRFLKCIFKSFFIKQSNEYYSPPSNKWTIFTRSSLSLNSINDSNIQKIFSNLSLFDQQQQKGELDQDLNGNNISIKTIQLNLIKSSIECKEQIDSFISSIDENILIVIADMETCNQDQINFTFQLLSNLDDSKMFITIYHFPQEYSILNQFKLNSIFLNEMEFIYIDSLGINFENYDSNGQPSTSEFTIECDIRGLISSSCGISRELGIDQKPIESIIEDLFFDQLTTIAKEMDIQQPIYSREPFYNNQQGRIKILLGLFKRNPHWYESLVKNFTVHWLHNNLFERIILNILNLISAGKESQSIIVAIKSSMTNFLYPITSNIVKTLSNNYAIQRVIDIENQYNNNNEINNCVGDQYKIISIFIESTKIPFLSDIQIDKRLEPVVIQSSLLKTSSNIPLFDMLDYHLSNIFNIVKYQSKSTMDRNCELFKKSIDHHPLKKVIEIIASNSELYKSFQEDFLLRTLKMDNNFKDLFISILNLLLPFYQQDNYSKILQHWVVKFMQSNIFVFLKNVTTPLLTLPSKDLVIAELRELINDSTNGIVDYNIIKLKNCFIKRISNILVKQLDKLIKEMQEIKQFKERELMVWFRVVKDLFNRIKFEEMIKIANENVTTFKFKSYIDKDIFCNLVCLHSVYQILLHIFISNYSDDDKIVVINRLMEFKTNEIEIIIEKFKKLNLEIKGEQLSNSLLLSTIKPIIPSNLQNIEYFITSVNNGEFEIGWSAEIIDQLFLNNQIEISRMINVKIKDLDIGCINSGPIPNFIKSKASIIELFTKVSKEPPQFDQLNNNLPLVDIMFHIYFNLYYQKLSTNIQALRLKYITLSDKVKAGECDNMDKILLASLSCLFLEFLASMINKEQQSLEKSSLSLYEGINGKEIQKIIKSIFNDSTKPNQSTIYQIYFFSRIINENHLISLFNSKLLLNCFGLDQYESLSPNETHQESWSLPFIYNSTLVKEHTLYKLIDDSISKAVSLDQFKKTIISDPANNTSKIKGFIRMVLFILSYQYRINNRVVETKKLIEIIGDPQVVLQLSLQPYIFCFNKILLKRFNDKYTIDRTLKLDGAEKTQICIAHTFINYIAIAIGSDSTHLSSFIKAPDSKDLLIENIGRGKFSPGFGDLGFVDCYGTFNRVDYSGVNLEFHSMVAPSWAVVAFAASVRDLPVEYFMDKPGRQVHFLNDIKPGNKESSPDYILNRALVSTNEIIQNNVLKGYLIDPFIFTSHYTFKIWNESFSGNSIMKTIFPTHLDSDNYYKLVNSWVPLIIKDYKTSKEIVNQNSSQLLVGINAIKKIRLDYSNTLQSLLISLPQLLELIPFSNEKFNLLSKYVNGIETICISKHFVVLIKFLHLFHSFAGDRIPHSFIDKTVFDSVQYLIQNNYETNESISPLLNSFEQLINIWSTIKSKLQIVICPRAGAFEAIVPDILNDTPLITIITSEGWILRVIKNWMDTTQTPIFDQCQSNEEIPIDIKSIISKFDPRNILDITDLPFEVTDSDNLLIGANHNPDDFFRFVKHKISQYFTFDKQKFRESIDWSNIQNDLAISYIYGKIMNNKLSKYQNFPFLEESKDISLVSPVTNSFTISEPEFIRELKELSFKVQKINGFNFKLSDESIEIKLKTKFKKLNSSQLEIMARYIIGLLNKISNTAKKDLHGIKEMKLIGFYEFKDSGKLNDEIIELLSNSIMVKMILVFSNIFIDSYFGFRYIYSKVIVDPIQPNQMYLDLIKEIPKSVTINIGIKIDSKNLNEWINHLKQLITLFTSDKANKLIKSKQPDDSIQELFNATLDNTFDGCVIKILETIKTPLNYYAYLMGTLQDTLTSLYIQLEELSTRIVVFNELNDLPSKPFKPKVKQTATQSQKQQNNKITPIEHLIQVAVNQSDEQLNKESQQLSSATIETTTDIYSEYDASYNPFISQILSTTKYSDVKFLVSIFQWIKFTIPLNELKSSNSNNNNNILLDEELLHFQSETKKKSVVPFNIDNLVGLFDLKEFSKFSPFIILNRLVSKLINGKKICNGTKNINCDCLKKDEINFNAPFKNPGPLDENQINNKIFKLIGDKLKVTDSVCSDCGEENKAQIISPDFLFISIDRINNNEISHFKFIHPDQITIKEIDTTFKLQSTIMYNGTIHINTPDGKIIRATLKDELEYINQDLDITNEEYNSSIMLIYKNTSAASNSNVSDIAEVQQLSTFKLPPNIDITNNDNLSKDQVENDEMYNSCFLPLVYSLSKTLIHQTSMILIKTLQCSGITNFKVAFMYSDEDWKNLITDYNTRVVFLNFLNNFR